MLLHVVVLALWDLGVGTLPVSVRLLGNGRLMVESDKSHRHQQQGSWQQKRGWTNASVGGFASVEQRAPTIKENGRAGLSIPSAEVPATSGGGHRWPILQSVIVDNESMVSAADGSVGWVQLKSATPEASGHPAAASSSESSALSGPRGRAIHHAALGDDQDWAELHEVQMALLESHAAILAKSAGLDVRAPDDDEEDPNMPEQNVKEKPEHWSEKAWKTYQTVYKTLAPLRGGVGNVAATFAAMGLGPENCVLKLAYILYSEDDEDDYPYLPRGCGDGFQFLMNTAGPHNWLGFAGTLLLVLLLEAGLPAPMHS